MTYFEHEGTDDKTLESNVRTYCRTFPSVFAKGEGTFIYDEDGRRWYDFLSGAGALNYGHNHPLLKAALLQYIEQNGAVTTLDLNTRAKQSFLASFDDIILRPRDLKYKVQFCGPTGANSVEAALKLACKATGRSGLVAFSNSYHGMSIGAMSVTASFRRRKEQYLNPSWVHFLPFDGFTGMREELQFVRKMLTSKGSGISAPAAIIVEAVQGEGGVNVASSEWLREIRQLATEIGAVLILDEIQAGCGRTGRFFSFEHHGVKPDMVCLSKSISGMGLPMSLLLIAPTLDVWNPGEHNGTFRGFNYAFVTAKEALQKFWNSPGFADTVDARCRYLALALQAWKKDFQLRIVRTSVLGMFAGIELASEDLAAIVQNECFRNGLIVERCGPLNDTLKLLPPVLIEAEELDGGLRILGEALARHCR
ncbi:diaminobutyrate--2-oxoglutarate transaminase [Paraburkholderia sp. BCC1876]|uniref:diaminobutyrate--2-oxoglutarate transaminase n=1 Tax=Paraburkholderia sp. BCC1876 TaxID=2676303 RepID=UPI0015913B80|nr:diaminobutyrate--2-oxoglutarate transaminase [Paraburkholderia sp. BCC1876]